MAEIMTNRRTNNGRRDRSGTLGFGITLPLLASTSASTSSARTARCERRARNAGYGRTICMADISKGAPGIGGPKTPEFGTPDRGGGVAVITKPTTKPKTRRKEKTEHEASWRVLLHNDELHTFDYVTGAIVKVN